MANFPPLLLLLFSLFFTVSTAKNHTVGGSAGWIFSPLTNASAANYSAWAASRSFHTGDFLIFNTDKISTVIQTYNATTYGLCSLEEDYGNLTSQFGVDDLEEGGGGGGIPVGLNREGDDYFFSSADGGFQCRKGMRFQIVVERGRRPPPAEPMPPLPEAVEAPAADGGAAAAVGWRWKWWAAVAFCAVWV